MVLNMKNEEVWELLFYKINKLEKLIKIIIRDLDNNNKKVCVCAVAKNENKSN
tara:strand:+ start:355 stop:513 length:159 start_codon:yes stop_codon:yes gene_type:complete